MKRKSGLADSPFFTQPTSQITPMVEVSPIPTQTQVEPPKQEQTVFTSKPEIWQSGLPENQIARKTESQKSGNLAALVQIALEMKNATKTSYRFPPELVSTLEDIPYQIKKDYQKRITKNAILVAALAFYIHDFQERGRESFLYQHLIEQNPQ